MYKYFCEKGCKRTSGSDGDESVRYEEDGQMIVSYNCNICGHTSIIVEKK